MCLIDLISELLCNANNGITFISSGLALLSSLVTGIIKIGKENAVTLRDLLPVLEPLREHANPAIGQQATTVMTAIATKNPRWLAADDGSDLAGDEAAKSASLLEEVLKDLEDPLLPIRTHALVALRKMVQAKDVCVSENVPGILALFAAHLEHPDSFQYLAAINGCVALGDAFPVEVVPLLVQEFGDAKLAIDTRLKIGEAIMKIAEHCGEALPHHVGMFLPSLFNGMKAEDAALRASCFSSLGSMCQLLRFSVHTFLEEMLECVRCTLLTDKDVQPQRGAVHLLTLLLRGLGVDAFESLGSSLTGILRLLRQVEDTAEDAIVRVHARAALAELHAITKQFMDPGMKRPAAVFLSSHFS